MIDRYISQVHLLVGILPHIAEETSFALKGGTAINLFYQDLPRLSVDIDLTWLPLGDRQTSLLEIDSALDRIMMRIMQDKPRSSVRRLSGGGGGDTRILVSEGKTRVKIETSPVARGSLYPTQSLVSSKHATELFGFVKTNVLAFEDVYGGKLHAALDRRHPRDLFDVKILYDKGGITDELFHSFLVYLASSNRPIHEILAPATFYRDDLFSEEFVGMVREPTSPEVLSEVGQCLHTDIQSRLSGDVAKFLLSLHDAEPDFSLIGLPDALVLPAVRWKIVNLEKLKSVDAKKHAEQRQELERLLL